MLLLRPNGPSSISCRNLVPALLLSLFVIWVTGITLFAAETPPNVSILSEDTVQELYKAAKDYSTQLENNSTLRNDRANWLAGIRNYRRIYLGATSSIYVPQSLFMMGKMHRRMFDHFHIPLDLDNAISYFKEVATLFPENPLADDALLNAADASLLHPGHEGEALPFLETLVTRYPKGDMSSQAQKRIAELRGVRSKESSLNVSEQAAPRQRVQVLPVKYWSSEDYTRIVIQTSEAVRFTTSLLEKKGEMPRRLYIDFERSFISSKFRDPVPIEDGLLKQVRTGQNTADTVRVVLDIESIKDYKVFSLNDPFRVIVDVHGTRKEIPTPNQNQAQSPPAPTKAHGQTEPPQSPPSLKKDPGEQIVTLKDEKKKLATPVQRGETRSGKQEKISLAQQLGLGVRKIVIDPGHGGKDPGAMAFGLKEKDIVLNLSKKIATVLKATYQYEVVLTRTKDVYIPLEERTAFANTHKGDLFLSIHVNAHPDKTIGGVETYFLNLATDADAMRVAALENATSTHNISELQDILASLMQNSKIDESSRLARFIQTKLVSGLGQKFNIRDLGVKQAPFYVLIGAEMPSILAEISFITNPTEARLLEDDRYLTKVAEQIAAGVAAYVEHHTSAALRLSTK